MFLVVVVDIKYLFFMMYIQFERKNLFSRKNAITVEVKMTGKFNQFSLVKVQF